MYIRLEDNMTKKYFREILEKAIKIAKADYDSSPNIPIHVSFYRQLIDIKNTVVEEKQVYTEEESRKKYPLGVMAIRNFDGYEGFEYKEMLVDISGGISYYSTMPEE